MALRYKHGSSPGNYAISQAGGATLWNVIVNTAAIGAILRVYEGVDATGTLIATIDASQIQGPWYGYYCNNGIFVVLSGGSADFTVGYR